MEALAAIVERPGASWVIEPVRLDALEADEILVRIVACGICQADLHARDQHLPVPLPMIFGHEGAGVVDRVGAVVTKVAPGDHVVLSFPSCGHCANCAKGFPSYCFSAVEACFGGHRLDGTATIHRHDGDSRPPLHGAFFQQSSFASFAIATERNVVKVRQDVPLELLGPLGCGIQTGAGAILNTLHPEPGSSLAVFGAGTVGLSAVMAAKVAGCATIVAVDINPSRLALAQELGATHVIHSGVEDPALAFTRIAPHGFDYSLEATGRTELLQLAFKILKPLGVCGLVGGAPPGAKVSFDMFDLLFGRTVRGIVQGDSVPDEFIPELIELYLGGRFPFDRLVRFYPFAEINQAAQDSAEGSTIKAVLRM